MSGYIGTQPVPQATQTRDSFTATSGQVSFSCSGYTPNFLDVFLNGVKLAAADYTATNGSDVVLASGASTGDILEVVAYTAFDTANVTGATNFTVTGAFTSQGIDDNGNATAITIDSSENVLIGRTSSSGFTTSSGSAHFPNGSIFATVDGGQALNLSRLTSDGSIAGFYKSGTSVGSIGVTAGDNLYIASTVADHAGLVFNNTAVSPWVNGAIADGTCQLGSSAARFSNLYLSGGVYLGGTGAANKLDDYEEGTWTPAFGNGTFSYGTRSGWYTKVGNLVTCCFMVSWTSKSGSGTINVTLPFTTFNGSNLRFVGSVGYMMGVDLDSSYKDFAFTTSQNSSSISLVLNGDNIQPAGALIQNLSGSGEIQGSVSFTAS